MLHFRNANDRIKAWADQGIPKGGDRPVSLSKKKKKKEKPF